jgi:hypothetical protein
VLAKQLQLPLPDMYFDAIYDCTATVEYCPATCSSVVCTCCVVADSFLKAKDLYSSLTECSDKGAACSFSMCYPCYCELLSVMTPARMADTEWVYSTRQECSVFISSFSMKSAVMK